MKLEIFVEFVCMENILCIMPMVTHFYFARNIKTLNVYPTTQPVCLKYEIDITIIFEIMIVHLIFYKEGFIYVSRNATRNGSCMQESLSNLINNKANPSS